MEYGRLQFVKRVKNEDTKKKETNTHPATQAMVTGDGSSIFLVY